MKKFVFIFVACFINLATFADPACTDSLYVIQPNGDTLWTYLCGDEFYHWRSTIDGHVIMRDSNNYYRYAIVEADSLQISAITAHNIEERSIAEREFVNTNSMLVKQFIHSAIQEIDKTIEPEETSMQPPRQGVANNTTEREPVVGTRKILTILIDFKDYSFTRTRAEFDSLMNQEYGAVGLNTGSVRQYYRENSYGQLDVISTVVGPFRADKKRSEYSWKHTGNKLEGRKEIRELVREAINHAKDYVDFSTLDGDGDGEVDCIHVVFAGEGLSSGSTDSYIWPHNSELLIAVEHDNVKAKKFMITSELYKQGQIATIGTICHEFGHILGAPDFYDLRYTDADADQCFCAIGKYDVMSRGYNNNNGRTPAHHNPYTKCYIFGWDTPKTISSETKEYTVSSSTNDAGNIYRIDTQTDDEFFLLEHRSYHSFDQYIPNWGLLIYHAHKDLKTAIDNDEDINYTHPLKLYLVNASADSNPNNSLDSYGKISTPRAFPGNQLDKTMFTSTTIPSAKAWNGSDLGVNLCFIRRTTATNIKFTVNPQIQGPSQLCGTQDYYVVSNVPSSDTVEWSYSTAVNEYAGHPMLIFEEGTKGGSIPIQRGITPGISADPIDPGDTTIVMTSYGLNNTNLFPEIEFPGIQLARDPYVGTATLHVNIKGGNGQYQLEKEIVLPEFVTPSFSGGSSLWLANTERTLYENSCSSIEPEYIKWYVRYPNTDTEQEYTGRSVTLKPTQQGQMTVRVVNDCGCEISNEATYAYSIGMARLSFPNPSLRPILPIDWEVEPYGQMDGFYTLEMWNEQSHRVKLETVHGNHIDLDVSDLPTGWYQITLRNGDTLIESASVFIHH